MPKINTNPASTNQYNPYNQTAAEPPSIRVAREEARRNQTNNRRPNRYNLIGGRRNVCRSLFAEDQQTNQQAGSDLPQASQGDSGEFDSPLVVSTHSLVPSLNRQDADLEQLFLGRAFSSLRLNSADIPFEFFQRIYLLAVQQASLYRQTHSEQQAQALLANYRGGSNVMQLTNSMAQLDIADDTTAAENTQAIDDTEGQPAYTP